MTTQTRIRAAVAITAAMAAACLSLGAAAQDPSPSPEPVPGLLGATTEVYRDDFSTPTTWTEVDDGSGRTAYENGRLSMSVLEDSSSQWDDHTLDRAWPVLRVEAWVAPNGDGAAGVACGSSLGLPRWLWAATDGAYGWLLGRIIDTRLQVVQRGDLPVQSDGRHLRLGIECASSPDEGGDHVIVTADGVQVGSAFDIPVGPFDKATLLVSSDTAPEEARFDDLVVSAGEVYVPLIDGAPASPAP